MYMFFIQVIRKVKLPLILKIKWITKLQVLIK